MCRRRARHQHAHAVCLAEEATSAQWPQPQAPGHTHFGVGHTHTDLSSAHELHLHPFSHWHCLAHEHCEISLAGCEQPHESVCGDCGSTTFLVEEHPQAIFSCVCEYIFVSLKCFLYSESSENTPRPHRTTRQNSPRQRARGSFYNVSNTSTLRSTPQRKKDAARHGSPPTVFPRGFSPGENHAGGKNPVAKTSQSPVWRCPWRCVLGRSTCFLFLHPCTVSGTATATCTATPEMLSAYPPLSLPAPFALRPYRGGGSVAGTAEWPILAQCGRSSV